MEAEEVALEVVEVLVEVPKSLRMPRTKLTQTKESAKYKKGKKLAISVCASSRRNPLKPTTQEKGKAINLEPEEEEIEDILMDDEALGVDMKLKPRVLTLSLSCLSMSLCTRERTKC